jgi:hypothetical protein
VDRPGNLSRIAETATLRQDVFGMDAGWHALERAVGVWPWWLREPRSDAQAFFEVFGAPPTGTVIAALVVVAGLAVVGVAGLRRRRTDLAVGAALALLVNLALVVSVSRSPERLLIFANKASQFAVPAGMFAWLVLGLGVAQLVARPGSVGRFLPLRSWSVGPARAVAAGAALGAVAVSAVLVSVSQGPDPLQSIYRPMRSIGDRLTERVPRQHVVQVSSAERTSGVRATALTTGLIYRLRREGHHPVVAGRAFPAKLGRFYSAKEHVPDRLLVLDERRGRPSTGRRLLVEVPKAAIRADWDPSAPFRPRAIYVSIGPVPARHLCPPPGPAAPRWRRTGLRPAGRGSVIGSVDRSRVVGDRAVFCGWAARPATHRGPDAVGLFVGDRPVAAVRPTVDRPDVLRAQPAIRRGPVGFSLDAPLDRLRHRRGAVRVVAVAGGETGVLPFACKTEPQAFGC